MCIKMSRSSESGNSTNSESSIDINILDEITHTHHRDNSDKVLVAPKVMAPSFNASSAKNLTFSISRLLDSSSSPKCTETEDDEVDEKSCSSDAESPSPISSYSLATAAEIATSKELFDAKFMASSFAMGTGFEASQLSSSASSPTNSVIRVPAHRPAHSSMAYSVTYPWLAHTATSASFIKDGLPSKFFTLLTQSLHINKFLNIMWTA